MLLADDFVNNNNMPSNWGPNGSGNTWTNNNIVLGSIIASIPSFGDFGGFNTITNNGTAWDVYGSSLPNDSSSGGGNLIVNYNEIHGDVFGVYNTGSSNSIYGSKIVNHGTIDGDVYGNANMFPEAAIGGDNVIENYGKIGGSVYGIYSMFYASGSDVGNSIINDGEIVGSIKAGMKDDTVTIKSHSSVGGYIDGEDGDDTLQFESAGEQNGDQYLSFEHLEVVEGDNTITGTLNIAYESTIDSDASLTVAGALDTTSINNYGTLVNGGVITGTVKIMDRIQTMVN